MKRSGIITLVWLLISLLGSSIFSSPTQATGTPEPKANPITAQNAKQVKEIARLGKGRYQESAWLPDGNRYAVASTLGIWLYDASNFEAQPRFIAAPSGCSALAISSNGNTLACGGQDGSISLWEVVSGTQKKALRRHAQVVMSIAFSPDGKFFISGDSDGVVYLWDVSSFDIVDTLTQDNSGATMQITVSPDSKTVGIVTDYLGLTLWDIAKRTQILNIGEARGIAFGSEAGEFATGHYDTSIHLWKAQQETAVLHVETPQHQTHYYFLAFTPDGNTLISNAWQDAIHIWDVKSRTQKQELGTPTDGISAVSLSPRGETLVFASVDGVLHLWDVPTGAEIATLTGFTSWNSSLALHPSKPVIAVGEYNLVRLWNIGTGVELQRLVGNVDVVRGVAFSPDGTLLASSSQDGKTIFWNVEDWQPSKTLQDERGNFETNLAFSPDGTLLASASLDNNLRLWDVKTGKLLSVLTGHTGHSVGVVFTPEGSMLASGSYDGVIRIWDIKTHRITSTFSTAEGKTRRDLIANLAFNPDATIIAASTWGGEVYLWDVKSGKQLATITGNTDQNSPLAFSPDGSLLVFSSADYSLSIYDMQSSEIIHTLTGHIGSITGILINSDGTKIITSSGDGTVRIWGLQP